MRRLISLITLTAAAALSACSGGPPTATSPHAHSTTPTRPAATTGTANNATPQTPITIATTSTTATGSSFCPTARRLGLDHLGIGQDPTSAPDHLLRNLDKLDALAPPAIRADFDTFTKLEHALVGKTKPDPGDLAKLNSPSVARSLRHVGDYLRVDCGIGKS
jgi:hypothetical protein